MFLTRMAVLGAVALGAAGCASTTFKSTWVEPNAQPLDRTKKVATVMITERPSLRRSAELAMVREIASRGVEAVASHALLPGEAARDTARAKAQLAAAGVDAVLLMRVVSKDQQITYSPGTPYYSTWGYWGYGWGAAYSPGQVYTDQIVSVETLVYSVSQGKLVWAGMSETTNPSNVDAFVQELVVAVGGELRKAKLIQSQ